MKGLSEEKHMLKTFPVSSVHHASKLNEKEESVSGPPHLQDRKTSCQRNQALLCPENGAGFRLRFSFCTKDENLGAGAECKKTVILIYVSQSVIVKRK